MNRWIGILVCLLWSSVSFANELSNLNSASVIKSSGSKLTGSNYEFGVLKNKQCNNGCEIKFNKTYHNPVVFLMASVDGANSEYSYPTKLSIYNVTTNGATIYSDAMPNHYYADKMQSIYYMVADPGELTFFDHNNNKKTVEVGVVETNRDQYKGQSGYHARYSWSNVWYGISLGSHPVVLAQIQKRNNSHNYWVSSALSNVNSSSFNIAIERGRQGALPSRVTEKIAYIAAPQFHGFNDSKDTKVEFYRPDDDFDQEADDGRTPIENSCYENRIKTQNVYSEFGVIINKQTRNGSDGGWLRYCQQRNSNTSSGFSFAFDEDNENNRSHGVDEYVGYLAFESNAKPLPPSDIDICKYVPDVAQTNDYVRGSNGTLKPNGVLLVSDKSTIELAKSNILSFGSSSSSDSCDYGRGKEKCVISKDKTYDGFPFQLNALTGFDSSQFNCDRECTLASGKYNQVRVGHNAKLTLSGDYYEINELIFEQNSQLLLSNDTQIKYNSIYFYGQNVLINQNSNHKLLLLGYGYYASFYIDGNNTKINAYIYINSNSSGFYVAKNNNMFIGGITAKKIEIPKNNNKIIAGEFNCTPPIESKIARVDIIPNNYHLTCDDTEKVYVVAYDQNDERLYDVGSEVVSLTTPTSGKMDIVSLGFNTTDGRYEFSVDKKDNKYESVVVNATLQSNTSVSDSSNVLFTPLKFEINEGAELELIAGKPATFAIKALACSSGKPVTTNYEKTLNEINISSSSFTPGNWTDNRTKLSFNAPFVSGIANASLTFNDAGKFTGTLSDTIQCSDFGTDVDGCPIEDKKKIAGDFSFKARPWTFAICNSQTKPLPQGNIINKDSARFVAAGEKFATNVLPIRWMANQSSPIETANNYCDSRLVTQNFFLGQGESAGAELIDVVLTHDVAEPAGKEKGVLSGNTSKAYTDSASKNNPYYQFSDLDWSEVGVLKLTAAASAPYFGMNIDPGYRDIGRFYPDHFAIRTSEFLPQSGLGSAAYMAQPYQSAQVYVEAFAKEVSTQALKNYHWFDPQLTVDFELVQDTKVPNQLILNTLSGRWVEDNGNSAWVVTDTDSSVTREVKKLTPLTTIPNGPLNTSDDKAIETKYALGLTDVVDPATFIVEGEAVLQQNLPTQPQAHYGRMSLGSVGGTAGSDFGVPLRTEYWDGERFTLADNDNQSQVISNDDYLCKETLWLDDGMSAPTNSSLIGSESVGEVVGGEFDKLKAKADSTNSAIREQVRFWMRMAASSPQQSLGSVDCGSSYLEQPWLQYNWRGQGDEDPSTAVTFGIYRGNDKIIFRGESGVMGQ